MQPDRSGLLQVFEDNRALLLRFLTARTRDPEKIAIERDQLRHMLREIEKLPERTRQIFIDFRLNDITQKQIAANLGISISAVEKHLQRAYRVVMDCREKDDAGLARR